MNVVTLWELPKTQLHDVLEPFHAANAQQRLHLDQVVVTY